MRVSRGDKSVGILSVSNGDIVVSIAQVKRSDENGVVNTSLT